MRLKMQDKLTKRKGVEFPQATIHTKSIIIFNKEFIIYEQYGNWHYQELEPNSD